MTRIARAHVGSGSAFNDFGERVIFCAAVGLILILLTLTACSSMPSSPTPSSTAIPVTPIATETNLAPASPTRLPTLTATQTITLTIWAPEEFSPEAAHGGQVLQQQIQEFTKTHPNIAVTFVLKNPHGEGGLLDFLLKVQSLVPSRLPDLIVLDSREIDVAAKAQLLQPLNHDLPAGAYADLLDPAQQLADYQGEWLTQPMTLDVEHLVYNAKSVRTPPATWDQLLKGNATFGFPADDDDAFLFQYLENHGRLSSTGQSVPLDVPVTTSILTFYQKARTANLVPDSVFTMKTTADVWQGFAEGQVGLAQVDAGDYLANYAHVPNVRYAPLPTQDGASTTLVSSWNYAIVTSDPTRHAAAAEFLNWVNEPSRLAAWATAAQLVPARRSAFVFAISPSEYADFLLKLLGTVIIAPTFAERAQYSAAWHTALQSVLRGQATPAEAALKAAQTPSQ